MASRADRLECLFFVAVGLVLGGIVASLIYAVLTRRGSGEPGCGRCGYSPKAAVSFTCPECGSDLREVGIVHRPAHLAFAIATCAGLAIAGATIVLGGW